MKRTHFWLASLGAMILAVGSASAGQRSVAELIGELKKADAEKYKAMDELAGLGEKASSAVPALIDLLPSKSEDIRLNATITLGKIGKPAVEPLTVALASSEADVLGKTDLELFPNLL